MEDSVIINRFDSFDEMKWKLGEKPLIFCEEEQSRYAIISIGDSFEFGLAYNVYGIDLMFEFDDINNVCYIGAGQNLLLIDIENKEILFNKLLFSPILDVINIENTIYVICDLELICYSDKKEKWKLGFYHMALSARVPIVFGAADFKTKKIHIGRKISVEDLENRSFESIMDEIQDYYKDFTPKYPEKWNPKIY